VMPWKFIGGPICRPSSARVNSFAVTALAGGFTNCSAWIASACSRVISLPRISTRLCSLISSSLKSEAFRHSPTPTWTKPSAHFSTQAFGTATSFTRV
jgi:hypothetical protein